MSDRRRRTLTVAALAVLLGLALLLRPLDRAPLRAPLRRPAPPPAATALVRYDPARAALYVARAISGEEDPLFLASPGGALATAARVARLHPAIAAAASAGGFDPSLLEGLVFVESAGRPDAIGPAGTRGAAGLTQILPSTAVSMLGLRVDAARSATLTQAIAAARGGGASASAVHALEAERASADERFDIASALRAAVRYLHEAEAHFGRADLAVASYHMGLGNLDRVLSAYDGGAAVPYPQLTFDTAPDRHAAAYRDLTALSDQSSLYFWRVLGATALMHLYRTDRGALAQVQTDENALGSGAEVLHPPASTPTFANARALADAYAAGDLVALPSNLARFGLTVSASATAGATRLHTPPGLLLGLRPAAAAVLEALGARVHALAPRAGPVVLTSAVSDWQVEHALGTDDPPAAAGWSFTVARPPAGPGSDALDAVLGRMQALDIVALTGYPSEIEVTASSDAARVLADGP